jgi:hypothetical protein
LAGAKLDLTRQRVQHRWRTKTDSITPARSMARNSLSTG